MSISQEELKIIDDQTRQIAIDRLNQYMQYLKI